MEIDAGLRASAARLRATIEELYGADVLGTLVALGVVTRADLVNWERQDLHEFVARLRQEEAAQ